MDIVLQKVTKLFHPFRGEPVIGVQDVTLNVQKGEIIGLTGPSGAGKSTLLRIVAGLEEPTSGTITLDGKVVNKLSPHQRDVGMVFQQDALFPHLNVRDNVGLGLRLRKVARQEIEARVRTTAEMLGITDHLNRYPKELSGGERQRVALGRAIVRAPKLLLLDEPLVHLDPTTREKLRGEILRIQRETGVTMIYVTHDSLEASQVAKRIAVLDQGRLVRIDGTGHPT